MDGMFCNCPDIDAWMRYIAMVKSVASKAPRFFESARALTSRYERIVIYAQ